MHDDAFQKVAPYLAMYTPICYLAVRFFTAKQVRLEGIQSSHVRRVPIFYYLFGVLATPQRSGVEQ